MSLFSLNGSVRDCDSNTSAIVVRGPGDLHPVMLKLVMTQTIPTSLQALAVMSLIKDTPSFPVRFNYTFAT